jgi:hypothetical protein
MSKPTRNALLVLAATLAVLGVGWWAFARLTAYGPPDPSKASPDAVAEFLGNAQGLIRLTIAEREAYLRSTFEHFSSEESRARLGRCIRRMSDERKQTLVEAPFEVVRVRMLEAAERFNRLPLHERDDLVRNLISDLRRLQGESPPGVNKDTGLGESFKGLLPATGQDWNKLLITRTTPEERTKAGPLALAIAKQLQEEKDLRRKTHPSTSKPDPSSRPVEPPIGGDGRADDGGASAPS